MDLRLQLLGEDLIWLYVITHQTKILQTQHFTPIQRLSWLNTSQLISLVIPFLTDNFFFRE